MVRISLVPALTPLYLYVSTFRSMCAVPIMAILLLLYIIIISSLSSSGIISGYTRRCYARALNQASAGSCIREYRNECMKPGPQSSNDISGIYRVGIFWRWNKCLVRLLSGPGRVGVGVNWRWWSSGQVCQWWLRPAAVIYNVENTVTREVETVSPVPDGKVWGLGHVGVCK
jgi:hypothetical protein